MLRNQKILTSQILFALASLLAACASPTIPPSPTSVPVATPSSQANLPNPASVYCEQQGYRLEVRTGTDSSQIGVCLFPDGSECDEWAYFRGECGPTSSTNVPTAIPTALPIDAADYQGWWTYTHQEYNFSIMLPEDWVVEEVTSADAAMNDHTLNLHPREQVAKENIHFTFRQIGEEARLWPMGVGQGQFIPQGTLEVAGQPAQRVLLVCPSGEITAIWYHQAEGQPNITRGELEFGFIYSLGTHCEPGYSLSGKAQRMGEMILASLKVP